MSNRWMCALLVTTAIGAAGCENTRAGIEKDAENAAPKVERAVEQTSAAARDASAAVKAGAETAAQAAREQLGEAAEAADATQQAAQIKLALMSDASIDSTTIDVDADADARTVTLKGHVRSAEEKASAGRIAAEKAPGYRITNDLEVRR